MTYNLGMVKIFPFIFIILWSSAFVTTKPIIDNSDPFAALAFRFFVVAFGFFIFSLYTKQKILTNSRNFFKYGFPILCELNFIYGIIHYRAKFLF